MIYAVLARQLNSKIAVKVGQTENLKQRLAQCATFSPGALLIATLTGNITDERLHVAFRCRGFKNPIGPKLLISGTEWFCLKTESIAKARETVTGILSEFADSVNKYPGFDVKLFTHANAGR